MEPVIFDGKLLASQIQLGLRQRIADLRQRGVSPKVVWFCVGNDPASLLYGRLKSKAASQLGVNFESVILPRESSVETVVKQLEQKQQLSEIHGVLVQLPIAMDRELPTSSLISLLDTILPDKDVDCLTSTNLGKIMLGEPYFLSATVKAVGRVLLNASQPQLLDWNESIISNYVSGKRVCVVGGGIEVGRPLVAWLSNLGATVLWTRSSEVQLEELTRQGEIIISAVGNPGLISAEMVSEHVVIIDVGSPHGDVQFDTVSVKSNFITPVPGGVGPLTVLSLLENVVDAAERQNEV